MSRVRVDQVGVVVRRHGIPDERAGRGRCAHWFEQRRPHIANSSGGVERGPDIFPAKPQVDGQARARLEIVLNEAGAVVTAVMILKLALRSRTFIGLNALYVTTAERAEIIGGA